MIEIIGIGIDYKTDNKLEEREIIAGSAGAPIAERLIQWLITKGVYDSIKVSKEFSVAKDVLERVSGGNK